VAQGVFRLKCGYLADLAAGPSEPDLRRSTEPVLTPAAKPEHQHPNNLPFPTRCNHYRPHNSIKVALRNSARHPHELITPKIMENGLVGELLLINLSWVVLTRPRSSPQHLDAIAILSAPNASTPSTLPTTTKSPPTTRTLTYRAITIPRVRIPVGYLEETLPCP
jgi:hypothetical protein